MPDMISESVQSQSNKRVESTKPRNTLLKKIDSESARLLASLKDKANKKPFGRKVRETEILALALRRVTPEDLKELQQASFSEHDRLKIAHDEYQKKHGKLTLDQFVGKLLRGDITQSK